MNERLVEDWLARANERSYQTPFAQSLLADGFEILRVGHSAHEHGKDVIAIDPKGKIHAYQLKDGNLDLKALEANWGQINALVETQVEHPALKGQPNHQPWLVVSGETSIPAEDRIRTHNITWKKRGFTTLRTLSGRQLLQRFAKMASNFWPQMPEDSHRLFNLYLTEGHGSLDRDGLAKLLSGVSGSGTQSGKADAARRLAAANLFASYAMSPFYAAKNHWELIQGWTITAAQIAWSAVNAGLPLTSWRATFRMAVEEALNSLQALAVEALQQNALGPGIGFEIDELTRTRCTICAGAIAVKALVDRYHGNPWEHEQMARETLERLLQNQRICIWGESAVPFLLAVSWAVDQIGGDYAADKVLYSIVDAIATQNSSHTSAKLAPPYDPADEANAKLLSRVLKGHKAMELQATASYALEPAVLLFARRLWRNVLAGVWSPIAKVDIVRLVPESPIDLLLWTWGNSRGSNQSRKFSAPQSWTALLAEARRDEDVSLPDVLKSELDFALLFLLCFPHRLTTGLAKNLDNRLRTL
ncbi:MAG: hypothetical protein ABSG78_22245 [Verrucomicrobiota bacterium]|jgi:hypothetical protein